MSRFKVTVSNKQRRETEKRGQASDACDACPCDLCVGQELTHKSTAGRPNPQLRGRREISPLS